MLNCSAAMAATMPSRRWRLFACTLLLLLLRSTTFPAASSAPISSFDIPFTTYGPAFANPAGVARVNATIYGGRLPYPDLSLPVLSIATAITQTGPYNAYASILLSALPFAVDMINAHGGLFYNGSRYLLALTWASDDSSDAFLQLLYSEWLNDPHYFLFLMPATQQQQLTVWPLVEGTNRTWMSILTLGSGVLPDYRYRYNMLPSWAKAPLLTLATLDQRAQLYHQQIVNGTAPADANTTSPFGILTVCLYTHNDSSLIDIASGVRGWVNQTNAARRAAGAGEQDLIVILQDVFWPLDANSVDQDLYQRSFDLCPDNVDLLVVAGEIATADVSAVTAALKATMLRPKVAFTTSSAIAYNASDPAMLATWQWWVTQSSLPVAQATLPTSTFGSLTEMGGAFAYYTGALPNVGHVLTMSMLDAVRAALASSASLSSDDLRAAFLGLSGATFAQRVRFNNITGNNDASTSVAYQLQSTGLVLIQNLTQLAYPAPFPWRRTVAGDAVSVQQQGSTVVVAVVISVLGCWVAQIVLEQAVYAKRRGGLQYLLWLLVVAVVMGGSGVWCAQFALSSAVSFSIPSTGELAVEWALPVALLGWLAALLLTWSALAVGVRDFSDQSGGEQQRGGAAYEARQAHKHEQEEKRKRAALDTAEHLRHLARSLSRHVLGAALLLTAAVMLSRVALSYVWSAQAAAEISVGAWLVTVFVCFPLVAFAVLLHFHALRNRVVAVFALAGAILLDWEAHLTMGGFRYTSSVLSTPSALYAVLLSSSAVTLLCGVVAAVTCFVFVGLQFSRMQLSRNGLSVLVATMEASTRKHRRTIDAQQAELQSARLQADAMAKVLECIALLRPLHAHFSLALSSQANASTLRQLFDPLVDSGAAQSTAAGGSGAQAVKRASEVGRRESINPRMGSRRQSAAVAPIVAARTPSGSRVKSQLSPAQAVSGDANAGAVRASSFEEVVEQEQLAEPTVDQTAPLASASADVDKSATRSSISAWLAKTDDDASAARASSPATAHSLSLDLASPSDMSARALANARSSQHSRMTRPSHSPTSAASSQSGAPALCSDAVQSINSQSGDAGAEEAAEQPVVVAMSAEEARGMSRDTHAAGWKQFESDVLAALQHHDRQSNMPLPHTTSSQTPVSAAKRGSAVDLADLSFLLPSILASSISRRESTVASTRRPSLAASSSISGCPFPTPSLQQLLQSPVCVEVVKDELCRLHSEESLTFYLHALRYRHMQSAALRRTLAKHMHETWVAEGSAQQINVSTAQRNAVAAALKRRGDEACGAELFRECEREVLLLMETNMNAWQGGVSHRMCVWLYYAVDAKRVVGWQADEPNGEGGEARGDNRESSFKSSYGGSVLSSARASAMVSSTRQA